MNRIYKSVWCETTGTWVATSETARARGKRSTAGTRLIAQAALAGAAVLGGMSAAHADPVSPEHYFSVSGVADGSDDALAADGMNAIAAGPTATATGLNSIAIGNAARALSNEAISLGTNSAATASNSVAVGVQAKAQSANSLAFGANAFVVQKATDSVAIGSGATASAANSVALGAKSTTRSDLTQAGNTFGADESAIGGLNAKGEVSLGSAGNERRLTNVAAGAADTDAVNVSQLKAVDSKVGAVSTAVDNIAKSGTLHYFKANGANDGSDDASASGEQTVAAGANASAAADYSVAIGASAAAGEIGATAIGTGAEAKGETSTAIGAFSSASGLSSVALGDMSAASGANALALGAWSDASADNSVALGKGSVANRANSVSVGAAGSERQITSVAAGTEATDAVNLSQLQAATKSASRYFKATGNSDGRDDTIVTGDHSVAMGSMADASGMKTFAGGTNSWAQGDYSTAVGTLSYAQGYGSAALGYRAKATADNSVALGQNSLADRANTVSVGSAGAERQITNVAAGVQGTDAVNVNQLNALAAQGAATAAKVDGAVMYDQNPDGSMNRNSITLGDTASGGTVIHNVADGVAATDAVNVGQLNGAISDAVNNAVVNTANPFISAEGDRDTEGAVSSGTHSLGAGANAQATGTNAAAVGANSVASGNNATALGAAANASADNSVALGQGSVADRANTVSVGAAGQERQITNVAAGVQGTDAVNVNQMQQSVSGAVSQANNYTNDQIRSARRDSYGGTASALAAAGLPQAVLPGHGMVAMAGGTYGGQSAMAIGVSQLSETGKWVYKVQGTTDSRGQFGASVGAGMHW
jgi:autotransporter adhesin